ncbi:MAG TPA: serine hydrolase domain-containing protein [Myxococcota bacterium]|nr:serine hydrolase domain-containing protein [Myxococcota bacterium]
MTTPIEGFCAPGFEGVRDAFAAAFASGGEVGAAVAAVVGGEPVVDLWAGHADQARTRPWTRDTLVNVYSTTKGMTAICAHHLVERGKLDLDAPVARVWPEFAAADKGDVPLRWLLSHRAGLPAVRTLLPREALYDWDAMTNALAAETPWWTPGERHGYHALTFGWLVGEVVRRASGKSVGRYFRDEIAGPLGADFHIGLADAEHDRVAEMSAIPLPEPGAEAPALAEVFMRDPMGMAALAFMNPPSMADGVNHAAWRRAEIPGANGHATARAIARIYAAIASGAAGRAPLLSKESIERCREEQSRGMDAVLQISTRFGGGFMRSQADVPGGSLGPGAGAFGHPGAGGSLGFADPEAGVGFGYAMNRMGPHILLDPRATALVDALYDALG